MTDRFAVLWTRAGGKPVKMGNVVATERECRVTYDQAFVRSGLPGFSLIAPPAKLGTNAIIHRATERFPLHPRLMVMIPPNTAGNLQRRVYAELLAKRPVPPAPGFDSEWEILMLAGRNGIGHLDVFPSDLDAQTWYDTMERRAHLLGGRSGVWRLLQDEIQQTGDMDEATARELAEVMGPTPTVGGMTSKILVAIPDHLEWDGTMALPGTSEIGRTRFTDVIVKIEQPGYEGVTALEALAYDIHEELGFQVPRRWRHSVEGLNVLAVERFDRTSKGLPITYEGLLTIFAGGSTRVTSTSDLELHEVAAWIRRLASLCAIDVNEALMEIFRRLAVALMTGNGDLHLENLGLLGGFDGARMAPVFDPAPMRAWQRHNIQMAIPIDFNRDKPIYTQIARQGLAFGLTETAALGVLRWAHDATLNYRERVGAATGVPDGQKERLIRVVGRERELLQLAL
ncbi:MAG: serine/threonine-protein kinase HipA [Pseudomonadota bacterium]|nr:serine/threonine-protein kinase HipA [Pseudomonadota bacterium]